MNMLSVRASVGVTVPFEGRRGKWIVHGEVSVVPDTLFYRRRIERGELEHAPSGGEVSASVDLESNPSTSTSGE
jgi:hypothetical protein